jgi:uncharacterized protein VirK/YbjX
MVLRHLFSTLLSDLQKNSPITAVGRFGRVLVRRRVAELSRPLTASKTACAHQSVLGVTDPYFALSHKHYLSTALTHAERVDTALRTYGFIDKMFGADAITALIGQGLTLWSETVNEHSFDLRLMLGNDNMYEGGLSAVFHVDGKRVGVMSFALADGRLFGHDAEQAIWICRNQTTTDRWYQKPLQDAFKQIALPYLMLACVAGIGRALNHSAIYAITEATHPHATDAETIRVMGGSYSQFWQKYFAEEVGRGNVKIRIPLESTPLDQVSSNHRRRAKARREVMERVSAATAAAFAAAVADQPAQHRPAQAPPVINFGSQIAASIL